MSIIYLSNFLFISLYLDKYVGRDIHTWCVIYNNTRRNLCQRMQIPGLNENLFSPIILALFYMVNKAQLCILTIYVDWGGQAQGPQDKSGSLPALISKLFLKCIHALSLMYR